MDIGSGLPSRVHAFIIAQCIPFFQKNRSTYFDPKREKAIYKIGFFAILAAVLGKEGGVCDIFLISTILLPLSSGREK